MPGKVLLSFLEGVVRVIVRAVLASVGCAALLVASGVPAEAASPIQFGRIYYNSPGTDRATNLSVNGEYVVIKNVGTTARSLTGWTVRDAQSHVYKFGTFTLGAGKKAQVEFVSANPTGPLHVGNGRGAAIGDALASALGAAGYRVEREYYVNDAGTQTDTFSDTLYVRYQQLFGREVDIPKDGYPGDYMVDLAREIKDEERVDEGRAQAAREVDALNFAPRERFGLAIESEITEAHLLQVSQAGDDGGEGVIRRRGGRVGEPEVGRRRN